MPHYCRYQFEGMAISVNWVATVRRRSCVVNFSIGNLSRRVSKWWPMWLELNAALTQLYWTQVSLILLVIIATVIVSEWVSAKIRHAII